MSLKPRWFESHVWTLLGAKLRRTALPPLLPYWEAARSPAAAAPEPTTLCSARERSQRQDLKGFLLPAAAIEEQQSLHPGTYWGPVQMP